VGVKARLTRAVAPRSGSHELRTPLTAILGWAHMLRAGQFDGDSTAKALETIERNARFGAG